MILSKETKRNYTMRHIHSGKSSYINKLHRDRYRAYTMVTLQNWHDGTVTVEFIKGDNQ
jgi:hypothetical protein